MPCQIDCLSTYSCGLPPNQPLDGAIFSPYVKLQFGKQQVITVGNESSPPNNHATISSFQYGFGPQTMGWGADFEVIDQGGTLYRQIIRAMHKTITNAKNETLQTMFDFGWIIKNCSGQTSMQTAYSITGKILHGLISEVDQTFEGGIIKLKFKIRGPQDDTPFVPQDDTIGDEANKVTLKDALRQLFTEHHPQFGEIQFRSKDDGELCFKSSDGGCDGPKGAWPLNQQNPLAAARTWLSSISTNNDRGILITYDPNTAGIIFQEDKQNNDCCSGNIGTYIVNGGNCSPVLEFNPTVRWQFGLIPGSGATPAGAASGANNAYVEPTIDIQKAGGQTSPAVQQHEWLWRHPDELATGASDGNAAHIEANGPFEFPIGFSAQLKIHGDPSYSWGPYFIGKTLSIIVINPFHINDKCTWITSPNCNSILSNKNYIIRGVSHQITGGSYVTTLDVLLTTPNSQIDATEALGGTGCGTETFDDNIGGSQATNANGQS